MFSAAIVVFVRDFVLSVVLAPLADPDLAALRIECNEVVDLFVCRR